LDWKLKILKNIQTQLFFLREFLEFNFQKKLNQPNVILKLKKKLIGTYICIK